MNQPPISELLAKTGSKYALVVIAAKRGRQITKSTHDTQEDEFTKPITKSLHEIAEGKIDYFYND
ncbi:MAG: DNA-directed RNA polymerase subunit omega [Clostridia bacterium]|nr:DNA-directed RNA polymerase subunit omega [Clostridia bacterium]